jgi:hypothetical protein
MNIWQLLPEDDLHFPEDTRNCLEVIPAMPRPRTIILSAVIVITAAVTFASIIQATHPVTWILIHNPTSIGEWTWAFVAPRVKDWVNITVERIRYFRQTDELQDLGNRLFSEFGPVSATLPEDPPTGGRLIPLDRLPDKFAKLGGSFGDRAELILQEDSTGRPMAVAISWAHLREAIVIFPKPPRSVPRGFFVRALSDRIYVVTNES